jgi:WD40 repeat protein
LWDFATGELIETIDWNAGGLTSPVPCQIYSAQFLKTTGDLILAGGSVCNEVKLIDTNLFKPIAQIKDLSRATYTVDFSNNGDMFAMGGGDGVVRVFNIVTADI